MISKNDAVILFDGVCNFCNGAVQFVIRHDSRGLFRFASLQSSIAKQLLSDHSISHTLDSVILIEGDHYYTESTAILKICRQLDGFLWKCLYGLIIIPKPLRDIGYRLFAKYRYKLFGKQESCMIPTPEIRQRFLEMK
ncbi:thiol-disulfide oxidoreductase DCC family protein [Thermoflavimicrobium daqui]|jgi:predicted DCC family thiol-disulfide oxidoreductase YuxK|uniref:Thiol-disulfide oxidoreductase n=1 Tax=Thermoflavimicrobium daqui TaxID=2137476 RepID=A0A364K2N7_9BACL|nr:thiol-disulfide oxidoreductase DCC family protein [Thermoflavimicrobium daqui]RAL22683.1 thiol-disulfide oxidoreductase [Thermoflavimicrobium daqui]